MSQLDVIVPVHNQKESIPKLIERLDKYLLSQKIDYNLIFVDDFSTDGTKEEIKKAQERYPNGEKIIYSINDNDGSKIKYFLKQGKKGENYSILEGLNYANAPFITTINGGLKQLSNSVSTKFKLFENQVLLEKVTSKANFIKSNKSVIGSGINYNGKSFITHTNLKEEKSALKTFYPWQKYLILEALLFIFLFLLIDPLKTIIIFVSFLTFLYFIDLIFSFKLVQKSIGSSSETIIKTKDAKKVDESKLPIYSILCPLYKEARVLPSFIKAIKKLNWPKNKLDVILLLEEDDKETQDVVKKLKLPDYIRTLIIPDALPKTKPKACNYGLAHAKGEFLVIYDAEDRPDPLQLKKAYLAFQKLSPRVVCLQCKLNYYNTDFNLLTRFFTAEYSLWFDLILPGLQAINTTIPLGGTSNHFKTFALRYLDAWDPFNVTEDCDLGVRLFKEGFQTAMINSTTYEEANSRVNSWIRQRSRWIKGYMQTFLVHMRNPIDFFKKHGIHALIFQLVIGVRMIFILVNPILWLTTISYFLFREQIGPTIESFYPPVIYYLAVFTLVFGNFFYLYIYMIACAKRKHWRVIKYVFLTPFYWILTSFASIIAFYQLIFKPYHWEKTQHGLHLFKNRRKGKTVYKFKVDWDFVFPKIIPKIINFSKVFIHNTLFTISKNFLDILELFNDLPLNRKKINGKLRILIFNWRDLKHVWSGGAEVYVHEIAKRWVRDGHKVTVFSGWDGKTKRYEQIDGVDIVRRGGFYTVYFYAILYYFVRLRKKYDIVIDCENGIPFFTPLYVDLPKILVIHHVHQDYLRSHAKFPFSYIAGFLEKKLMPFVYRSTKIITISESSKRDILNLDWGHKNNVDVVNPGVNLNQFKKFKKTAGPSFIYLGRLKPYKNVDIALKAFSRLSQIYPSAKLTIVGKGESERNLKQIAESLNIINNVTFTGYVDEKIKAKLLGQSWVSIQPSSFEGWGITVVESNTAFTPVIASNIGGLNDSVLNNITGLLVPERSINQLYLAMKKIIDDKFLREFLSLNAHEWSKKYDWEISAQKFIATIGNYLQSDYYPNVFTNKFNLNNKLFVSRGKILPIALVAVGLVLVTSITGIYLIAFQII